MLICARSWRAKYRVWRDAITNRIRRDQEDGKAAYAPDPEAFANVVIAMFTGAMTIAKAEQNTTALRAAADQLRAIMR